MSTSSSSDRVWSRYAPILAGGWRCTSYHLYDSQDCSTRKLIAKPHGNLPLARLLISPNGYLSAHIARQERLGPLPSGKQWVVGDDTEVAHVARGLSMYCGYMTLHEDAEGLRWQTQVEVASDPARVGRIEERLVRIIREDEGLVGNKVVLELSPRQDMLTDVRVLS